MIKIFFSLLIALPLFAAEDKESIYVSLETESPLMPLYLSPMADEGSALQPSYLLKLNEALAFDLNMNGMTTVIQGKGDWDQKIKSIPFNERGDLELFKKGDAFYLIKTRVKDKKLSARLITLNSGGLKAIDGLDLKGDYNSDLLQIHFLADRIFKELFNQDGIASTHILYTIKYKSPEGKPLSEVYECDYDGKNNHAVTKNAGYAVTPAYVPPKPGFKAGSFFYVSYKNGQPKIFYSSLAEFNPIRFSLLKGNQLMPAVSKQRDKVAFICDVTGNPDLFCQPINADGTPNGKPSQIFATHKATQGTPTFSPDGSKIAFVSNKDGSPRIYMMPLPASGTKLSEIKAKLITRANKESTAPNWSPDGTKIAYTSMTSGSRQIWIYDLKKDREWQLTKGKGNKENPSWGPDSHHLAFNTTDDGNTEIYIISLNRPEAVKITSGPGEKRFPNWEPR